MAAPASSQELQANSENKAVVPLTTWVLISNFKLSYNLLRRPDGSFNRYLAEFLDRRVPANLTPVDGVATMNIDIEKSTGLWGRLFWTSSDLEEATTSEADTAKNDEVNAGNPIGSSSAIADANDNDDDDVDNDNRNRKKQKLDQGSTSEAQSGENRSDAKPVRLKPLLIYFHGGSFVHSSANSGIYDAMCRRIARLCHVVVLSVNFRRAPEHRFPTAYDDGVTSVRWAQSNLGRQCLWRMGCDPSRCYLAGDSSGGNIAHNVAVSAGALGLHLSGMVLLMPMFGGEERTKSEQDLDGKYFVTMNDRDWYWRAFLPEGATREHPACNPFSKSAPPLSTLKLPPSLVVVGGLDILQDWQLNYVEGMREAGKYVDLMFLKKATMGFFLLPNSAHFYSLVDRMKQFFRQPQP